jgi:hypothetical protein
MPPKIDNHFGEIADGCYREQRLGDESEESHRIRSRHKNKYHGQHKSEDGARCFPPKQPKVLALLLSRTP